MLHLPVDVAAAEDGHTLAYQSSTSTWVPTGAAGKKSKLNATGAPTTGDDTVDGYEVGSLWYNATLGTLYVCTDATEGAAVWLVVLDETVLKQTATNLGFFGATPAAQQTGGSATAGDTYTATEKGMIQKAYDCLRTFGLLS